MESFKIHTHNDQQEAVCLFYCMYIIYKILNFVRLRLDNEHIDNNVKYFINCLSSFLIFKSSTLPSFMLYTITIQCYSSTLIYSQKKQSWISTHCQVCWCEHIETCSELRYIYSYQVNLSLSFVYYMLSQFRWLLRVPTKQIGKCLFCYHLCQGWPSFLNQWVTFSPLNILVGGTCFSHSICLLFMLSFLSISIQKGFGVTWCLSMSCNWLVSHRLATPVLCEQLPSFVVYSSF